MTVPASLGAEVAYSADINVTTSDGKNPQPVVISAGGVGHVPVARIDIPSEYWDIDYGNVELGFEFGRPLVIRNLGDLTLTFDVVYSNPVDPDRSEFALETDPGNFSIVPGGEILFKQTFEPTSTGSKDILLRVETTNDPTFTSQDVLLHGIAVTPIPIDAVLVLDRSGSMSETIGEVVKIEALRTATAVFIERLRDDVDYLGLTQYNHNNSNILDLGPVSLVEANANSLIGSLNPSGATGIGGAIETAADQYDLSPPVTAPDPTHRQVMVVLTDGKENVDPSIRDVLDGYSSYPGLFNEHPDLRTYSIGLGLSSNINEDRLQEITNRGLGGFYLVTGSLDGLNLFNLENFLFKIFTDATGGSMVADPTYYLGAGEILEIPISVISEDRDLAVFFIGELPASAYRLGLVDPSGNVLTTSGPFGSSSGQVTKRDNWALFRIQFPSGNMAPRYSGTWMFRAVIDSVPAPGLERVAVKTSFFGRHRVSVAASVSSDYKLTVSVGPEIVQLGHPILIKAALTVGGWPAPDGQVSGLITDPTGMVHSISLSDDGLHADGQAADGVFGGSFQHTFARGSYAVAVHSSGVTEVGERADRVAGVTQFVGVPAPDQASGPCLACGTIRLVVVFLILVLIALLMVIWWCVRTCAKHTQRV
jgi:hypothetical protein